ncbi:MAG: sigma-E factor negative regulatory protein [Proteobacteria bacterium]|nr:sigma-E factor negative regulatory protein [Pseudomonadota bacterium]
MNTKEQALEHVSALADGELADSHVDLVMASLRHPERRDEWDIYHQIGDMLRSDDMVVSFSTDFSTRLAARLEAEPTIIAPNRQTIAVEPRRSGLMRRLAIPGMAAAVAGVVFVMAPMVMGPGQSGNSLQVSTPASEPLVTASAQQPVMLRDPRIDEYLMAHQRYSPAMFSAAQYARSANFASDTGR